MWYGPTGMHDCSHRVLLQVHNSEGLCKVVGCFAGANKHQQAPSSKQAMAAVVWLDGPILAGQQVL